MSLNHLHLRYFYEVAKERSFTRASARLRIAQPALSKMIQQLEASIQKTLLVRSKKEITLTAPGEITYEYCHRLFSCSDELERVLKVSEITRALPLRIGSSDFLAARILPSVVKQVLIKNPNLYPVLQTGTATELCDLVERKKIDLAVLFHIPEVSAKLRVIPLHSVRFNLVVAQKYKKKSQVLQNFIGSREVDEESARRFPTLSKWKMLHPNAQIGCSSNSLLAQLEMVRLGLGIAVLPNSLVGPGLKTKALVDLLPKEDLVFELKLVTLKHAPPHAAIDDVLDAIALSLKAQ